jgi:hypothetical protein
VTNLQAFKSFGGISVIVVMLPHPQSKPLPAPENHPHLPKPEVLEPLLKTGIKFVFTMAADPDSSKPEDTKYKVVSVHPEQVDKDKSEDKSYAPVQAWLDAEKNVPLYWALNPGWKPIDILLAVRNLQKCNNKCAPFVIEKAGEKRKEAPKPKEAKEGAGHRVMLIADFMHSVPALKQSNLGMVSMDGPGYAKFAAELIFWKDFKPDKDLSSSTAMFSLSWALAFLEICSDIRAKMGQSSCVVM